MLGQNVWEIFIGTFSATLPILVMLFIIWVELDKIFTKITEAAADKKEAQQTSANKQRDVKKVSK
jgi:hypothetical protein